MRFRRLIFPFIIAASLMGCKKEATQYEAPHACSEGFQSATVVQGGTLCNANGYLIRVDGGTTYTPDGLPVSFQQNGVRVCVVYTIYQDLRMCPCCGGTRMKIQQIARQ